MMTDSEIYELTNHYKRISKNLKFVERGILITDLFVNARNHEGIVHNPTIVTNSTKCACGCKRDVTKFKPVVILSAILAKDLEETELLRIANNTIEITQELGITPLHALRIIEGKEHIVAEDSSKYTSRTCPYFPPINLMTGVYV